MALFVDYLPLIAFFVAFKIWGIFVGTAVAIVASLAQIAWVRWQRGRIGAVHMVSLVVIVVFGGATLILQDETFIKWKPTVLYSLFASILAVARLAFGRNLLATLLEGVHVPAAIWTRLTFAWVGFFSAMAIANWYVAFHFSTDTWANFKVWGGIGLFLAFAFAQGLLLARHLEDGPASAVPISAGEKTP